MGKSLTMPRPHYILTSIERSLILMKLLDILNTLWLEGKPQVFSYGGSEIIYQCNWTSPLVFFFFFLCFGSISQTNVHLWGFWLYNKYLWLIAFKGGTLYRLKRCLNPCCVRLLLLVLTWMSLHQKHWLIRSTVQWWVALSLFFQLMKSVNLLFVWDMDVNHL